MTLLRYSLLLVMPVLLLGCDGLQDLEVQNENNPNRSRALATPSDLESLASGTFDNFHGGTQGFPSAAHAMAVGASTHKSSWGNFSMRDHGREPAIEFNNSPSYNYASHFEDPYFDNYTGISNAVDVLASIGDGEDQVAPSAFEQAGAAARARAFAKFNMGLSYLYLGAMYDRGALLDETEEFQGEEFVPWSQVIDFGVQKLNEARQIAQNNEFTIPSNDQWFFNTEMSSTELAQLAQSMKAKYVTLAARTPEQRSSLSYPGGVSYSWDDVYNWIESGMEASGYSGAFGPVDYPGDPAGFIPVSGASDTKFHSHLFYGQSSASADTWARSDYRSIGPAQTNECEGYEDLAEPISGIEQRPTCYDEWKSTLDENPNQVLPYKTESPDRRIQGANDQTCGDLAGTRAGFGADACTVGGQDFSDKVIASDGKYHGFRGRSGAVDTDGDGEVDEPSAEPLNGPFPIDRGTWFYSDRGFDRFFGYNSGRFGAVIAGPMPHTLKAEMDLLKAEAILQGASSGSMSDVVDLINNTRVENGELPPAETSDDPGSMSDPQNPLKDEGATLWSMLKHERVIETWGTSAGVNFFIKRGWGDLREGMQLHYPVPGSELETLGETIYTFGGVGGRCSVGNPTNCIGGGGSGESQSLVKNPDHWSTLPSVTVNPDTSPQ